MLYKHHKIPKHAGGTDDISNIEFVTIEEHAERHRLLWVKHGRWQDKRAWQGLSRMIPREELIIKIISDAAKQRWDEGRDSVSKNYEVVSPSGKTIMVRNLNKFCRENKLTQPIMMRIATLRTKSGNRRTHKGWLCRRV